MEKEAIAEYEAVMNLWGDAELGNELRQTYALRGYRQAMKILLQAQLQSLKEAARQTYVSPIRFATCYAQLGDNDRAFQWLEKAYEERSSKLLDLQLDADFDGLRPDRRFADLVRRVGLPPQLSAPGR